MLKPGRARFRRSRVSGCAELMDLQSYLITYDISSPDRLRKVYQTLLGYGEHLQLSVFRCDLTGVRLVELRMLLRGADARPLRGPRPAAGARVAGAGGGLIPWRHGEMVAASASGGVVEFPRGALAAPGAASEAVFDN